MKERQSKPNSADRANGRDRNVASAAWLHWCFICARAILLQARPLDCQEHFLGSTDMTDEIENLLDTLHHAHRDNARQAHYARSRRNEEHSTMPTTSFIYEFFLYNSIYQYDWEKSLASGILTAWPREGEEGKTELFQQNQLEKFIRKKCQENPTIISRALAPLAELHDLNGNWTNVTPDARITLECGQRFFKKIALLSERVKTAPSNGNLEPTQTLFELINVCRCFIYLVRNNIFHGSKSIGEISEPSQRKRIEVYDIFLKCLVSLFFLAVERSPVAADHLQLPIFVESDTGQSIELDRSDVINLVTRGVMKPEDSRLVPQFRHIAANSESPPSERAALFYPSAGEDVVTPVILGLPYCSEFYFYDFSRRIRICNRQSIRSLLDTLHSQPEPEPLEDEDLFHFEIAGRHRTIHCVKRNNLDFLERDVDLCFYFHRGDSEGEGGSGQQWDSKHLGNLARKVLPDATFHILTDGEPGGIHSALIPVLQKLPLPITGRGCGYYCGSLSGTEFRNLATTHHENPPKQDGMLFH